MFGWFRKRSTRSETPAEHATDAAVSLETSAPESAPISLPSNWAQEQPETTETLLDETPVDETPVDEAPADDAPADAAPEHIAPQHTDDADTEADEQHGLIPVPSARPAMPLSAHPNFVGLAPSQQTQLHPLQMLQPEAALTPLAQQRLFQLFDELFGPRGRYRLEWRTDRNPGDDAVFSEIMTADLVRRVQNTIADTAELERPEPLRAITSAPISTEDSLKRAS